MRRLLVIAAAGQSTRMGHAKAVLPYRFDDAYDDDDTFVGHLVRGAIGVVDDVVVTIPDGDAGAAVVAAVAAAARRGGVADDVNRRQTNVRCVPNAYADQGLSGSIRSAVDLVSDVGVVAWCPVDVPFADADVFGAVCAAVDAGHEFAAICVGGERGHPAACVTQALPMLWTVSRRGGPRALLQSGTVRVRDITHFDGRLVLNLNTIDDVTGAQKPP